MAEKILYLMGAGASAEAMPLVKATPSRADGPKSLSNAMLARLNTYKYKSISSIVSSASMIYASSVISRPL